MIDRSPIDPTYTHIPFTLDAAQSATVQAQTTPEINDVFRNTQFFAGPMFL